MTEEPDDARTALVIDRLESRGWDRTASSEALDYANLVYETDAAELEVDWMPEETRLTFRFEGEDDEHELAIEFGDRLMALVDLIVEAQDHLGSPTWAAFAARVVAAFPRTWEVYGDDDMELLKPE